MTYNPPARDPRQIIEELRLKAKVPSVRQLALLAGVQQPSLARYLAGKSETMEVGSFQALAAFFGVTLSELLGEVPLSSVGAREFSSMLQRMDERTRAQWLRLGAALLEDQHH